jgi:hypothetical protein
VSAAEAACEPVAVSRAHLTLIIAGLVRIGVTAPVRTEFTEDPAGRKVELQLPDGDQRAVTFYTKMFDLPDPAGAGWTTSRGLRRYRSFGSASTVPSLGWIVDVHCLIDAGDDRAVATAHIQLHDLAGVTA